MNRKAKIIIGILTFLLLGAVALYLFVLRWERVTYFDGPYDEFEEESEYEEYANSCNVLGINIHGSVYTYLLEDEYYQDNVSAEDIYYNLEALEKKDIYPNVNVVVLEIDSYGGSPVASQEIAEKVKDLRKSGIPVIATIRDGGASGAYWIASAADRIFASRLSDIGSIGVSMSYLDESDLNKEGGFTWNSLSSAKYKDAGNPEKVLTEEEKALFQRDLDIIHEEFVKAVAENRGLPVEKVRELADGSTMLGAAALEAGLIDEIGYLREVENYIRKTYDIEPEFCWE